MWPGIAETFATGGNRLEFPHQAADKLVGIFIAGQLLLLSQNSAEGVDMERLENVDEVWALCFRRPIPGFRLLGRFIEAKVFVGFRLYDRNTLDGIATYTAFANEVIADWKKAFGTKDPYRTYRLESYVGGVCRDVDQPEGP